MKKKALFAGVVVLVSLAVMWRCSPAPELPSAALSPARLFIPGSEQPEVRIEKGKPVELHVLVQQPSYVYIFDSLENGTTNLVWGPKEGESRFEAGEYAAEGLDFGDLGVHQLLAVTSPERLPGVEGWKNVAAEPLQTECPSCGLSGLSVVIAEAPQPLVDMGK